MKMKFISIWNEEDLQAVQDRLKNEGYTIKFQGFSTIIYEHAYKITVTVMLKY